MNIECFERLTLEGRVDEDDLSGAAAVVSEQEEDDEQHTDHWNRDTSML